MSDIGGFMKRGVLALVLLTLVGCTAVYRNHGYGPTDNELQDITVGVSTRDSVAEAIGRPSARGVIKDGGWYYVRSRWKHFGMKEPQEVDRQVVAISFDKAGVVSNVERFTLQDGRVIALSRRVTESNIKGVGFLRQLLGNIGNFTASDVLGN